MKSKKLIFVISIFLFIQNVFCQSTEIVIDEKDDVSLIEIDRLIRETEYDEALNQLKIYMEKNPLKFDLAQRRVNKIMNARKEYSALANRLIQLIQTDPGNDKEIYEITTKLEEFEKNPSDENLKFIADLKLSAEFNYFRSLFMEIQQESARLTNEGKYVEAVEKTKEGFSLYKKEFFEKWKDYSKITNNVNAVLSTVDSLYAQFASKDFNKKLSESVGAFEKSIVAEKHVDSLKNLDECILHFNELGEIINGLNESVEKLLEVFESTQELDEDVTDASFIPFYTRFILGVASIENSGSLGALKKEWQFYMNKMIVALESSINQKYQSYYSLHKESVFKNVAFVNGEKNQHSFEVIKNNSDILEKLYNLDSSIFKDSAIKNAYVKSKCLVLLNDSIVDLCKKAEQIDVNEKFESPNQIISKISKLNEIVGNRSDLILDQKEEFIQYEKLSLTDWDSLEKKYNSYLSEIFTAKEKISLKGWNSLDNFYKTENEAICVEFKEKMETANFVHAGIYETLDYKTQSNLVKNPDEVFTYFEKFTKKNHKESEAEIVHFYPDVCVSVFSSLLKNIEVNIEETEKNKLSMQKDFESFGKENVSDEIVQVVSHILSLFDETKSTLENYKNSSMELLSLNEQKIVQSQLAQNEADLRFSEAENALKNEKFDIARKKLQDSLSKYEEALNIQNNSLLREECDKKLFALGNEISKQENQIVVVEVRQLKNQARDAYFNGRFEDAEKYLSQASNRWFVTNIEPDEEIENLKGLVHNAILMHTGREVLPVDPLYPEISQLLDFAYQYFNEGVEANKQGKKDECEALLDKALEKTQNIQITHPIHQEAALLTLKINRLKDPKKFASEFDQKIKAAKAMCKNKSTQKEGYTNLLDYYALDPNYKGLKDLIYQVEIDIGIRQKKVENTEKKQSQNYVVDAKKLFDKAGDDEEKLKKALDKINQAIRLNPDNKDATALKDKITTKIGGTTSTVLSTEDERMYQLAVKKLQQNDIIGANAITMQLLKKKQNVSSKKIKDLKNKIDARL